MVRETFRMRSWARALSPKRFMAVSSNRSHSAEMLHYLWICRELIWALQKIFSP